MMEVYPNPRAGRSDPYRHQTILSLVAAREAQRRIVAWPGYRPTPLLALEDFASSSRVATIHYKQEGERFGLGSFKALGGAYAIEKLIDRRGGKAGLVITSATDGNHGRSVAWGAQRHGVRCIIYVHETVSQGRVDAIAAYGAEFRRVPGNYDDAVRAAAKAAADNGWVVVSDTSWPDYEEIPRDVMQGYAIMAIESEVQLQGVRPTHVFLQGGVGGMAASIASYLWEAHGAARPFIAVVEPEHAACLHASARAGAVTVIGGKLETIMAGLACGEPSLLAWRILDTAADAFMTIPDHSVADVMCRLAAIGIVGGESGVAGLAGFCEAARSSQWREALRIDGQSRILCLGTEGATDPVIYEQITGKSAEYVARNRP